MTASGANLPLATACALLALAVLVMLLAKPFLNIRRP